MKHLDLFSGIGGFALATEMVWDDVEHIFCDNDPFAQAILKKHWPNSLIYGDIRELTKDRIIADTKSIGWSDGTTKDIRTSAGKGNSSGYQVDVLTGGFPCQPFSAAGRRRGTEDDRHLWPEMLRVIREVRPTYVLGENVGGFLTWEGGLVFEQVCTDLEEAGYEVCPFVIPACALNAPHRRDRVWIAAHAIGSNARRTPYTIQGTEGTERVREWDDMAEPSQSGKAWVSGNSKHTRQYGTQKRESGIEGSNGNAPRPNEDEQPARPTVSWDRTRPQWGEDWPAVAAQLCTMDDGLPNGLARPRGWRNAALKGAGNAIVPQVAAEIMKAMNLTNRK